MVKTFSLKQITAAPVQYTTGGEVLGWGLRNVVGMAEEPVSGNVVSGVLPLFRTSFNTLTPNQ